MYLELLRPHLAQPQPVGAPEKPEQRQRNVDGHRPFDQQAGPQADAPHQRPPAPGEARGAIEGQQVERHQRRQQHFGVEQARHRKQDGPETHQACSHQPNARRCYLRAEQVSQNDDSTQQKQVGQLSAVTAQPKEGQKRLHDDKQRRGAIGIIGEGLKKRLGEKFRNWVYSRLACKYLLASWPTKMVFCWSQARPPKRLAATTSPSANHKRQGRPSPRDSLGVVSFSTVNRRQIDDMIGGALGRKRQVADGAIRCFGPQPVGVGLHLDSRLSSSHV